MITGEKGERGENDKKKNKTKKKVDVNLRRIEDRNNYEKNHTIFFWTWWSHDTLNWMYKLKWEASLSGSISVALSQRKFLLIFLRFDDCLLGEILTT